MLIEAEWMRISSERRAAISPPVVEKRRTIVQRSSHLEESGGAVHGSVHEKDRWSYSGLARPEVESVVLDPIEHDGQGTRMIRTLSVTLPS